MVQEYRELRGELLKQLIEEYKTTGILNGDSPKTQKNKREELNRFMLWLGDQELTVKTANEIEWVNSHSKCTTCYPTGTQKKKKEKSNVGYNHPFKEIAGLFPTCCQYFWLLAC